MAIFTNSSFLVIGFMRAEGMEPGGKVGVTIHMITHDMVVEAFTYSLAGMCWHCPPSQTNCTVI